MKANTKKPAAPKIIVMISNSYGMNLFIKKLEEIIKTVRRGENVHRLWFVCSTDNSATHKYAKYLRHISKKHQWINILNFFSIPSVNDIESGADFVSGSIILDEMKKIISIEVSEIHLSGTDEFIQTITKDLLQLGVRKSCIHSVFLGQGILDFANNIKKDSSMSQTTPLFFSKSNRSTLWTGEQGSLLEAAESIGLTPKFSCRNGSCGECKVEVSQGKICYDRQPEAVPKAGEILLCCSRPSSKPGKIIINI